MISRGSTTGAMGTTVALMTLLLLEGKHACMHVFMYVCMHAFMYDDDSLSYRQVTDSIQLI